MKKAVILVFLLVSLLSTSVIAQKPSLFKKQPALSVNFMLNDYNTARNINNTSLARVLNNNEISKITEMSPGLSIAYIQGLSDYVDFSASIGGTFTSYEFKNSSNPKKENLLLEVDANVNIKLLTDKYRVVPYATAGVGASLYGVHYGAYIPLGLGFQVRLGDDAFLFTTAQYRNGITEFANDHLNYGIGFAASLGSKN